MTDKEFKRSEIAKAAKELFTNFGYKAVSMDSIAERANVAKGTLYLYFKDKEALFYYLLEEFLQEMEGLLQEIKTRGLPLKQEIVEVIYTLLLYRKNQRFLFKVMTEARDMKIPIAKNGVKKLDEQVAAYIISRFSPNITQKINLEILAFVIIKSYGALAFEWEDDHTPLDERTISQTIGDIFGSLLIVSEDEVK